MMARSKNSTANPEKDICYTPEYALCPELFAALDSFAIRERRRQLVVWESACGNGMMVKPLVAHGYKVIATDIASGGNYFTDEPLYHKTTKRRYHVQVTNPPYTEKYPWIGLGLARGVPMALLMSIDVWGAKEFHTDCGVYGYPGMIWLNERVDYYMPKSGFDGNGAQFTSAWFTWGLDLPPHTYANITDAKKRFEARLEQDEQERAGQLRLLMPSLWDYAPEVL